jgi:ATP-dependent Clp protease protease subunit
MILNKHGKPRESGRFEIKAKGKDAAEVLIYEDIGEGWFGGVSAKGFADDLKALGDGIKTINVRINSAGGSVFDGVAIYNTLRKHGARIEVDIDGMALSIASVIAMAGDEIRMAENALFMIHDPWTMTWGNAGELREQADLLDKIKGTLVDTYVARSGRSAAEVSDWMAAETWMTAQEAQERGFVNSITGALKMAAKFDASRFKNPPKLEEQPPNYDAPKLAARKANLARLDMARLRASRRI